MANITQQLYLDHAATTPVKSAIIDVMAQWSSGGFNAGSRHHIAGSKALQAVEDARHSIAKSINARPEDIIFTSGATEANNLALRGLAAYLKSQGKNHIITSEVEHKSILEPLKVLEGFEISVLPVKPCGMIEAGVIEKAITSRTGMITIQAVNNETGTIQPLAEIADMVKGRDILFHTDAAQALGKIDFDVRGMGISMASLSAHKCGGPQGIGALYIPKPYQQKLQPLLLGGGQEQGLRAGTLPVSLCVGFGVACDQRNRDRTDIQRKRDLFITALRLVEPIIHGHSDPDWNVPGIINLRFPGIDSETLVMALPELAFGIGSACISHGNQHSHVIAAIAGQQAAQEAIRISFGSETHEKDLQHAAGLIRSAVQSIRQLQEAA